MNINLESELLAAPGVVNFLVNDPIEIKPGIFSPIYINIKATLGNPRLRTAVSDRLASIIGSNYDFVCGIESGGTYYASAVADRLSLPVCYLRHTNKTYGDKKRLVGNIDGSGRRGAIIDDVFATGLTTSQTKEHFDYFDRQIDAFAVFSYGYDEQIGQHLGIAARSIASFDTLCSLAHRQGRIGLCDLNVLRDYVDTYKSIICGGQAKQ